ncbi:MAG: ATP synthase subunit I [Bacilli bacterium]
MHFQRYLRMCIVLLVIGVMGMLYPPAKLYAQGFFIGVSVGAVNLWFLMRRIRYFTESLALGGNPKGIGMLARLAVVLLALMIVMKFPEHFHILGFLIGLLTTVVVIVIDLIFTKRDVHEEER